MTKPVKPLSRDELVKRVAELEAGKKSRRNANVASIINNLGVNFIRYGSLSLIAYFAYRSIAALAGQTTIANIAMQFLGNVTVSQWAAWCLAATFATSTGILVMQKRRAIKHLSPRSKKLEMFLDKTRSSSHLTETGETNPSDTM